MKIISKFKDYFDTRTCYANPDYCSDDFQWIRKESKLEMPAPRIQLQDSWESNYGFQIIDKSKWLDFRYDVETFVIGFCGEWYEGYKVIKLAQFGYIKTFYLLTPALRLAMDTKYIEKAYKKNGFDQFNTYAHKCRKSSVELTIQEIVKTIQASQGRRFNHLVKELDKLNLFKKHNTPTLLIQDNPSSYNKINLTINPKLEDYQFYKCIPAEQAYQEVEMYLANELIPKDDPDQLVETNVNKAERHGFDKKTSFRKGPTKAEKHNKRKKQR